MFATMVIVFPRAISVFLYSNENHHADLRRAVAESIMLSSSQDSISTEDATACRLRAEYIRQDGNWVGEDIIPVAAEYLKRDIHVFVAFANISPLVYSSSSLVLSPVVLAFYEPGHYKSVLASTRQNDDAGHIPRFIRVDEKTIFRHRLLVIHTPALDAFQCYVRLASTSRLSLTAAFLSARTRNI